MRIVPRFHLHFVMHAPTRSQLLRGALAAALVALPATLNAWGDAGHRIIGLTAAQSLPADMPKFFRDAAEQLSYLNPEPDRWKDRAESQLEPALNGGTSPDHYIDMDLIDLGALDKALAAPHRWAFSDSLRPLGTNADKMGLLPYTILEHASKLREDFRLWRIAPNDSVKKWIEARIIDDAGLLGHYVADGSNPHHTTKHHNGWVGDNPKGYTTDNRFHYRFESAFVQAHIKAPDVKAAMTHAPQTFPALRPAVLAYLKESYSHLEELYQLDGKMQFAPEQATPEQKAFAIARLAAGAEMLRDIWYTAWVTSGK